MLSSYLKSSGRNLVRNKLFSFINIAGLAIGMSVGLLVIAILNDLLAYDQFHEKKGRIYRIITHHQEHGNPEMKLASTSVKAGRQIRVAIPGIEDVTILRSGFGGDAQIGEKKIPVEGKWADNSFFRVFSFPLVAGDPKTALNEPYSLVITEQTAKKLFGDDNALGRTVRFDSLAYTVTGIAREVPHQSHLRLDVLVSFASADATLGKKQPDLYNWDNIWQNYVYLTLPPTTTPAAVQPALDKLCAEENKALHDLKLTVSLQSLSEITFSKGLNNNIGPTVDPLWLWGLGGLAFIVILSACFNYTNLSVARSLRRSREVSVRKVIGARRSHIMGQFMTESVIIALASLLIAFGLYIFLRKEFLSLTPEITEMVSLTLSVRTMLYFIGLAVVIGLAAGFLPAVFFSGINALAAMKTRLAFNPGKRFGLRKVLIVTQYTFSLIFISTTIVGYSQYKKILHFDLGFTTDNVINLKLYGADPAALKKDLAGLPEVKQISQSMMVTSLGSFFGFTMKYQPGDSALVWENRVDEHYLPLHEHTLLAGTNFTVRPEKGQEREVIVNQQVLKRFNIGGQSPRNAIGQFVTVDGQKLAIVGVLKDFNYGTLEQKIDPVMFRYTRSEPWGFLNLKVTTDDMAATLVKLDEVWKKYDKVHPINARFYTDQIEAAYSRYAIMVKVIGFIAVLAICIASLGLFGMVVFTIETRLKEVSIRKVLGADEAGLVYLLCKNFLLLLLLAAAIALPVTYLLFDKLVLPRFVYHKPIGWGELLIGSLLVMLFALLMIGSQTARAARINPTNVLKGE
ncbi:hypothetical protein BLX24_23375 [Arsenicibacter rosenii]|uniref:ABC transporter permease n=2 Tax=Arsenicibacter rosenii TaxID=1750698 RepID=A0A1S2VEQ7_9BACT|nr:hypothetical protein BLX24_23375 [Arsenicibacter rosenii]